MQRKKKRSIIFELHSIPIKIRSLCARACSLIRFFLGTRPKRLSLQGFGARPPRESGFPKKKVLQEHDSSKERLYLVSYSIPLSCVVALLLVGIVCISTLSERGSKANAADIMTAADGITVAHPEISMAVSSSTGDGYGNTTTGQVETAPGAGTAYRSHKITVTGQDIEAYQLTISGPTNLTPSSGASTVVSGADGKSGSSMNGNTWGYAWGDNSDEVTSMIYNTISEDGSSLACTNPDESYNVNCEKKLVFGANFAAGADGGTYTANVTVSLTSTPHLVGQAWSNESGFSLDTGIDDMQDIDKVEGGFCKSTIPAGSTITLRDSRGGVENFYKVTKMQDGTCWMTENLRLKGGTKITSTDSDVKSDWTLPANASTNSSTMNWGTDNNTAYMAEGSTSMKISGSNGWKEAYGNYYSWCAATAMSCKLNRTGAALNNDDAAESICPKGWKLPVGTTGAQSFQNLYNQYPNNASAGWMTGQTISYNGSTSTGYKGIKLGYNNVSAFFPAAGYVLSGGLSFASSYGRYWSRRANSDTPVAYNLGFDSSNVNPQHFTNRYSGYSVRCVAAGASWEDTSGNKLITADVTYMQDITKDNFTNKYCANTTAANALVPVGSTIALYDSRDGNKYRVTKMLDGTCWMTENLRLKANTLISPSDSDVKSDWTLPANASANSSAMDWGSNDNMAYMTEGSISMKINGTNGWKEAYGNYYSWCAATAESCKTNRTGAALSNADAAESICPKGWKLPTQTGTGSFQNLYNQYPNNTSAGWMDNQTISYNGGTSVEYNGLKLGYNSTDAFFPAAGYVDSDGLGTASSHGYYWSRIALSNTSYAYYLDFNNSNVNPQGRNNRYLGFSMRCIAEPAS